MISNEKNFMANAMSGKTARPCDYCVRRRARWYCAADDAFLCQTCDGSVHSANIVARRHQRIRLKTTSLQRGDNLDFPSWHRGLTRKARTRRHAKNHHNNTQSTSSKSDEGISGMRIPLIVPEMGFEDNASNEEENEEQLIFRVPILDPFMAELCNSNNSQGFSPSDLEFPQFDVDVETLFGKGMDEESHGIEELGFLDCSDEKQKESIECCEMSSSGKVKAEEEGVMIDVTCEPFELSFDYEGRDCSKKEDEVCKEEEEKKKEQKMLMLRLDYEAIRDAWESNGGSPWMDGEKPEIDPHSCWPHLMGGGGQEIHQWYEENGVTTTQTVGRDGGREARVSRYREKRRTRLFSKKIRYEVRKLNAEKRPRMKGRFVKRTSCAQVSPTPFPLLSK